MVVQIKLGEIAVDVTRKNIKNVDLSVYPQPEECGSPRRCG